MATVVSLEDRVADLEREVAELKRVAATPSAPKGLDAMNGIFRDMPEFDEIVELMREARRADMKQLEEAE